MLPSGWTRIDQDRFKLAVEALRKARATMDCLASPGWANCRPATCESTFPHYQEREAPFALHSTAASALLDGFSVDEITAAEEALA